MTARRLRQAQSIARQATDLALAAPQVVAHRVARMAIAGPLPSARDQREFQRMHHEKAAAFTQAWAAMFAQAARSQQSLASTWLRALMAAPGLHGAASVADLARQWQGATLSVLDEGLAPVRRKAVANARRLARTRLR